LITLRQFGLILGMLSALVLGFSAHASEPMMGPPGETHIAAEAMDQHDCCPDFEMTSPGKMAMTGHSDMPCKDDSACADGECGLAPATLAILQPAPSSAWRSKASVQNAQSLQALTDIAPTALEHPPRL
jgi:hypothetical protein